MRENEHSNGVIEARTNELDEHFSAYIDTIDADELRRMVTACADANGMFRSTFIRFCAGQAEADPELDRGWLELDSMLVALMRERERITAAKERADFLLYLESFKNACFEGECVQDVDPYEKLRADDNGDTYLDGLRTEVFEYHEDVWRYRRYIDKADAYFDAGDLETAHHAYELLIAIYEHDTGFEPCFFWDDDFPDLDLDEFPEIDIDEMTRRYQVCTQALESGASPKASVNNDNGS